MQLLVAHQASQVLSRECDNDLQIDNCDVDDHILGVLAMWRSILEQGPKGNFGSHVLALSLPGVAEDYILMLELLVQIVHLKAYVILDGTSACDVRTLREMRQISQVTIPLSFVTSCFDTFQHLGPRNISPTSHLDLRMGQPNTASVFTSSPKSVFS